MYGRVIKRGLDIVLSLAALLLLWPLFAVFAVLIKVDSPGPVLFTQRRVGRKKKLFTIYKFRTMKADTPPDVPTHQLQNSRTRITKTGAFLRRTSLDELPQLWNILVGDMSIIGPRPALWNQDDLVRERDKYGANDLRPGLTGYAQVHGRDELPIALKAELDGCYMRRLGFCMDVKIFFTTLKQVPRGSGVVEGVNEPPCQG